MLHMTKFLLHIKKLNVVNMNFGDFLGGTGSVLSSLFGGYASMRNTQNTNKTNLAIAEAANKTSIDIARENNALQKEMNIYNNEFSRNAALEMFDLENKYNTPAAQKARLIEAGINPATLYGAGSVATGNADAATPSAASSGISPSMPSLAVPRMETPPSVLGVMFQGLETLSKVALNKSNSKLSDSQSKQIDLLMSETLKQAVEETKNKEIQNAINEFNLQLNKIYSASERHAGVQKTMQEVAKMYEETILAQLNQETEKADALLKKANEKLTKVQTKSIRQQLPALVAQANKTVELIGEQTRTQKAIQANEYASAESHRQSAELTKEQRFQLRMARNENFAITQSIREGKQLDVKQAKATFTANVQKAVNAGLLSAEQVRQARELADKYAKDNESYWLRLFTGVMGDALDDALKAAAIIK